MDHHSRNSARQPRTSADSERGGDMAMEDGEKLQGCTTARRVWALKVGG